MKKRLNKSVLLEKQKHGSSLADRKAFLTEKGWVNESDRWISPIDASKPKIIRIAHSTNINNAFSLQLSKSVELHNALNVVLDKLELNEHIRRDYIEKITAFVYDETAAAGLINADNRDLFYRSATIGATKFINALLL
jgi:hypothetical protein